MKPELEAQRGEEARQLMDNRLFKEAVAEVEAGIVRAMKQCDTQSPEQHKTLILSLQLLGQVVKYIKTVADTGKMAEIQLKRGVKDRIRSLVA